MNESSVYPIENIEVIPGFILGNKKSKQKRPPYKAKDQLIDQYGNICFLAGEIHEQNYLTFHHITPVRDGGQTSFENGALLARLEHDLFNELEKRNKHKAQILSGGFEEFKLYYDYSMPSQMRKYLLEELVREDFHDFPRLFMKYKNKFLFDRNLGTASLELIQKEMFRLFGDLYGIGANQIESMNGLSGLTQNAQIKERLITQYGNVCFLDGLIGKKNPLTIHHIKPVCNDGKNTLENGALLARVEHNLFNELEKRNKRKAKFLNEGFREFKTSYNYLMLSQMREYLLDELSKEGYEGYSKLIKKFEKRG